MAHRVAPHAEIELDNIWYYVAKESGSIEIADRRSPYRLSNRAFLSSQPLSTRRTQTGRRFAARPAYFAVGKYVIVYRVEQENVLILHVFQGGQDIEALLGC